MIRQDYVLQELKKHGKRITGQRKIILEIILKQDWENCKDIYYEAIKKTAVLELLRYIVCWIHWRKLEYWRNDAAIA